jgi:uncharacterized short protein YbdD (DUF466 family)
VTERATDASDSERERQTRHSRERGNPVEFFDDWMPAYAGMTVAMVLRRAARGLSQGWKWLRRLSGDDAYERYLVHWRLRHHGEGEPLTRRAFYLTETVRRFDGIRRCC